MKREIKNPLLLLLVVGLGSMLASASNVSGQTFTVLHNFTAASTPCPCINSDGAQPHAGLALSGNTLYGTTAYGGSSGEGTAFAINIDGTGFTNLYNFAAAPTPCPCINSDGINPQAGFILIGNTLYGTAGGGGSSGSGTLFSLNTDDGGFTTLYSFTATSGGANSDGANPLAGLTLSGNTLYGTALQGGSGVGTVFKVNTDGSGFTVLHTFTAAGQQGNYSYTNSDGAFPQADLVLSGNTLYGTTENGGSSGSGTLFAVKTNGTGFTVLHTFTGSDGANPLAGLTLSGNTLYGTTFSGGSGGGSYCCGTLFAINTDVTGFTNLHSFTAGTNSDGVAPLGGLILSGNTLYGTTENGGSSDRGTVFKVKTDGSGFTVLYSFTADLDNGSGSYTNSDGAIPVAGLILTNNTLYGTTREGGSSGQGTVFSLTLPAGPPDLTITPDGSDGYFIDVHGAPNLRYSLQRAPSLTGPWATSAPQTADSSGLILFHDLFPPPDRSFYRTVLQ